MPKAALETAGLTKFYGKTRGIEDLDLRVEEGEVFGYLGPNGAGKTTTIRLLLDLIRPTRGSASIAGHDTRTESVDVRRLIGYLPGELKLPTRGTALHYLSFLGGLRGGVDERVVRELAARLELDLGRRLGDLSKGNKQKVGVIAAFMHDPLVLILDEPTSGLDPLRQQDILDLVRERAAAGGPSSSRRTSSTRSSTSPTASRSCATAGWWTSRRSPASRSARCAGSKYASRVLPTGWESVRGVQGVRDASLEDGVLRLTVEGAMDAVVKELARLPIQTLTSEPPELEEVFLSFYGGTDAN